MTDQIRCRRCSAERGTFAAVRDLNGRTSLLCEHCLSFIRSAGMIEPTNGQRSIATNDGTLQLNTTIVAWERGKPYPTNDKPAA